MDPSNMNNDYICTHLGDDYHRFHGAVVPPIYQNSLFVYEDFDSFVEAMKEEHNNYVYWRGKNPTVEVAEQKIAALEKGERCKLFSSGMAAISASIMTFTKSGDHILSVSNIYGPATKFIRYIEKFGISHTNVQSTKLEEIENAITPATKIIYLESPATMTFNLIDLPEIAKLAKQYNIKTIIDNTWATPIFQNPIEFGIDIVVHSVSKYLGGHSDIVGGALITCNEVMNRIFYDEYQLLGGAMSPHDAWLLTRGLRTLPIRMKAHQDSAKQIAEYLQQHPAVKQVYYPALKNSPDFQLGQKLLKGYSGLFSFELKAATFEGVRTVLNGLKQFKIGVSWGGFESLVLSPNYGYNTESLLASKLSPGLIRISIGLEDCNDLIDDLEQALALL
jgi:cystathionine beta-lyase